MQTGFATANAMGSNLSTDYDLFVNWVSEGAVCGGTETQCP